MVSNSPGTIVDIIDDDHLALYMSLWSIAPLNGYVSWADRAAPSTKLTKH